MKEVSLVDKERPLGIHILTIVLALISAALMLISCVTLSLALSYPALFPISIVMFVISVILFYVTVGFYEGRKWAWWSTIVVAASLILLFFLNRLGVLSLISGVVIILYLLKPHVKSFFGIEKKE